MLSVSRVEVRADGKALSAGPSAVPGMRLRRTRWKLCSSGPARTRDLAGILITLV